MRSNFYILFVHVIHFRQVHRYSSHELLSDPLGQFGMVEDFPNRKYFRTGRASREVWGPRPVSNALGSTVSTYNDLTVNTPKNLTCVHSQIVRYFKYMKQVKILLKKLCEEQKLYEIVKPFIFKHSTPVN